MDLNSEIRFLKGVGEKRSADFKKLGVSTVEDLLRHYPRDYVDYSNPVEYLVTAVDSLYITAMEELGFPNMPIMHFIPCIC